MHDWKTVCFLADLRASRLLRNTAICGLACDAKLIVLHTARL